MSSVYQILLTPVVKVSNITTRIVKWKFAISSALFDVSLPKFECFSFYENLIYLDVKVLHWILIA